MKILFQLEEKDYVNISLIRTYIYKILQPLKNDFEYMEKLHIEKKINSYEYNQLKNSTFYKRKITEYFKDLFVSLKDNKYSDRHEDAIKYFLQFNISVKGFNEIYYKISYYIIEEIEKEFKENSISYVTSVKKILGQDLHIISSNLHKKVEDKKLVRRRLIEENFFFMFNGSSADKLNNYFAGINQDVETLRKMLLKFNKHLTYTKNICDNKEQNSDENIEKIRKERNKWLEKLEKPVLKSLFDKKDLKEREFKTTEFLNKSSKMFSDYSSHSDSIMDKEHLSFIIEYIIINGFALKERSLHIELTNNIDQEDIKIKMHEIPLLKSIFVIVQNAIDANAKNININIYNSIKENEKFLIIDICNDGIELDKEGTSALFIPFYSKKCKSINNNNNDLLETTKINKDARYSGYGLNLAIEELEKFKGKVILKNNIRKTCFSLEIPLTKDF